NEQALMRHGSDAMKAVIVAIGKKDEEVVTLLVLLDVLDHLRAVWSLLIHPSQLIGLLVRIAEQFFLYPAKSVWIPLAFNGKATDRQSIQRSGPLRIPVAPGDVVLRASGENFHIPVLGQVFGHIPAMELGPAVDLFTISLNDKRDLHKTK